MELEIESQTSNYKATVQEEVRGIFRKGNRPLFHGLAGAGEISSPIFPQYRLVMLDSIVYCSKKGSRVYLWVAQLFHDVVYKIKTKKVGLLEKNKKAEEKVILNGVSGMVEPGEILAMLGPSGSGKTTLLTALGGRLGGQLHGTITYNGKPFSNSMKRKTGFVPQDDVLYPNLTVSETLVFTALLRLPNSLTKEEKMAHANAVMSQLGLISCKDSIIGGPLLRGVSGGERKRVSIGQEMLVSPSLLFLDEPTSGLDSTTAQRILSTLSELASEGKTIVMAIHQPSSRIYYMFHKALLLSEGNVMYFGKGSEAIEYFSNIGYAPTMAMNPADFLLDLANGRIELDGVEKWSTSWWQQFSVLLRRYVKERKHQSFAFHRVCQILLVSLVAGLLWYKSDISHLQDQIGLLYFIVGFWAVLPLHQAIYTFPQELLMLKKERSSGMYRLSSYFMSRMVAELPMELTIPTIYLSIIYWMAGLKANVVNYLCTLFSLILNVLVSQGIGLAIGAIVMDQKSASALASVMILSFLLVGGFYVQHVPKYIAWIKYLSTSYYVYRLLMGSQYATSDTYPCSSGQCLIAEFPMIKQIGLHLQEKIIAATALGIMLIGYRLVAYFALMRIGVTKKLA
ncbi:hypothetical protein RIF29_31039 [Crotalaria pallida]|uniref:ABC transporter domain-containing protein n=1 Tax=Crotalaria pallida TaxID=3830 RepID=A0AAN9EH88_CROPI